MRFPPTGPTRRQFLARTLAAGGGLVTWTCWRQAPRDTVDVCIVGSGPAAAVLAKALAAAGARVTIVESAPRYLDAEPRLGKLDAYRSVGEIPYPASSTRMRARGGTSVVWTGHCPRLHPGDFARRAFDGGSWPFDYAELEPYYERAEDELAVQGRGASPGSPPRRRPLTLDADPRRDMAPFQQVLAAVGIEVEYLPLAVVGDGPIRFAKTHWPALERQPQATVLYGATARRLRWRGDRVRAVEIQGLDGPPASVRADHFVIAGGGLETPRLLMLSDPGKPFAGDAALGRGFMEHLVVAGIATLPGFAIDDAKYLGSAMTFQFREAAVAQGLGGVILKLYLAPDPLGARQAQLTLQAEIEMESQGDNRLELDRAENDPFGDPGLAIALSSSPRDRATVHYARALVGDVFTRLRAVDVRTSNQVAWAHHHLGSCRAGRDRARVFHPSLRRQVGLAGARWTPRCPLEARIQLRRPSSRGWGGAALGLGASKPLSEAREGLRSRCGDALLLGRSVALAPADQEASSAGVPGGPRSDSVELFCSRCPRILSTTGGSVRKEMIRIWCPHSEQSSGSAS